MWPGRVHQLKVFIFGWHFFMLFRLPREASRGKMRLSLSIIRRASFVVDLLQCWSMMHPRGMCAIANFRIHRSVDGYFIFTVSLKKMHRRWRYSTQQYILWGDDAIGNEVTGAHLMDTEPNIVSLVYVVLHHPPANERFVSVNSICALDLCDLKNFVLFFYPNWLTVNFHISIVNVGVSLQIENSPLNFNSIMRWLPVFRSLLRCCSFYTLLIYD